MRIHYVGLPNPVITAIEEKIVGETPEQIFESLQTDITISELELLLDWYEQKERACNSAVWAPK
ncbi:MAG: hypothetical protein ACYSTG_01680 [Planctomycetota bacterium]|jgi:hypothetical protein